MNVAQLSQQLSHLSDSLKQTNLLITRLAKLSFQPGSEPLDSEQNVHTELAQDIQDSLKHLEEDLELSQQDIDYFSATRGTQKRRQSSLDSDRERVAIQAARLDEDLKRARNQFRRAQLTAKRSAEAAKQQERELIFASIKSIPVSNPDDTLSPQESLFAGRRRTQPSKLGKDEALVAATSDVTAALRRTHNLLSTELSRSRFAQETLERSSAALAELGERYTDLDSVLSKSRALLGTLLRSQKSDTWYLETAFYILLATLCWLFFRRILFGPFIKLPLFLSRVLLFALRWSIWKPFFFFLTITGIVTSETADPSQNLSTSSSRTPLIVHPSASSGPRVIEMSEREALRSAGVPAGAGGAGAKSSPENVLDGELSEEVGKLTEGQSATQGEDIKEENVARRGDGTILRDRQDEPPNPKKKAFDVDVEDKKQEQRRKRDEL